MGNRIAVKIWLLGLFSAIFLTKSADAVNNHKDKAVDNSNIEKLRDKEAELVWKNALNETDYTSILNDYFIISYPKCFSAVPTVQEEDDDSVKNSASLSFTRTKSCKSFVAEDLDPNHDENQMQFFYDYNNAGKDIYSAGGLVSYSQRATINGVPARITASVSDFSTNKKNKSVGSKINFSVYLKCEKEKYDVFKAIFVKYENKPKEEVIRKNIYEVPEDYRMIISSFRCKNQKVNQ